MNGISGTKGYIIANNIASNTVDKLKEAIESGKTVRVDIDKNTYGESRKKGQIYEVLYVCNGKIHDENTAVYFGEIKKYMGEIAPYSKWHVKEEAETDICVICEYEYDKEQLQYWRGLAFCRKCSGRK